MMHSAPTLAGGLLAFGPAAAMTFRVYVRWPRQATSDKTVTESRAVAEAAFDELAAAGSQLRSRGAVGISFTEDGKQLRYVSLLEAPKRGHDS